LRQGGIIVSLVKPQYEISARELVKGRLSDQLSEGVVTRVITELRTLGINVVNG
jgi:hypothetical protein